MSVNPAYFLSLSTSYLKAMIADSEVWRALVAKPDTDWGSLQTLITAATSSRANALERIVEGRLEEDEGHAEFVKRPRVALRHFDENTSTRVSTSGFAMEGLLYAGFEYPIPEEYKIWPRRAYIDAENKIGGIIQELTAMQPVGGYLHLKDIIITGFGQADPDENNGEYFYVAELAVHHRGSVIP